MFLSLVSMQITEYMSIICVSHCMVCNVCNLQILNFSPQSSSWVWKTHMFGRNETKFTCHGKDTKVLEDKPSWRIISNRLLPHICGRPTALVFETSDHSSKSPLNLVHGFYYQNEIEKPNMVMSVLFDSHLPMCVYMRVDMPHVLCSTQMHCTWYCSSEFGPVLAISGSSFYATYSLIQKSLLNKILHIRLVDFPVKSREELRFLKLVLDLELSHCNY